MKYTWLVLSPHFDDAVLSIPLWMLQQIDKGHRVIVVTLFSSGDPLDSSIMKIRQEEDQQALAELGCESAYLGFLDAPFRAHPRSSFLPIVFDPLGPDKSLVVPIKKAITQLATPYANARIVAPLAVGTHIDHRLVNLAITNEAHFFYEDRPYALIDGAVQHRLAQLGARSALEDWEMSEFLKNYPLAGYVESFLDSSDIALVEKLLRTNNKPGEVALNVSAFTVQATSARQIEQAERAIMAYTSQINGLFPKGIINFWENETIWKQLKPG